MNVCGVGLSTERVYVFPICCRSCATVCLILNKCISHPLTKIIDFKELLRNYLQGRRGRNRSSNRSLVRNPQHTIEGPPDDRMHEHWKLICILYLSSSARNYRYFFQKVQSNHDSDMKTIFVFYFVFPQAPSYIGRRKAQGAVSPSYHYTETSLKQGTLGAISLSGQ